MGSTQSIGQDQGALVGTEGLASPVRVAHPGVSPGHSQTPTHTTVPLWLWWNILSLDAPAVALAWALLFARVGKVHVPAATIGVLVLAVWLIYLADRLLDGLTTTDKNILRERHRFCARHRVGVCAAAAFGAALSSWLAYRGLNAADVKAGLLLVGLVAAYMLCVHLGGPVVSRIFPKEAAVAVLFAAGTALPVWSQSKAISWSGLALWALFAVICTLNCVAIESWENQVLERGSARPSHAISQITRRVSSRVGTFAALVVAVSLPVFFSFPTEHPAIAALAGVAVLILLLNRFRKRLSGNALRVLADAALLAPAIIALVFRR